MFPKAIRADDAMIYANESAMDLPVGQRVELPNGRIFRYALAGATDLVAGLLQQSSTEAGHNNNDTLAITADVTIGDDSVAITNGASTWTEDELKGGFLILEGVGELGAHYWEIDKNTAEAAGAGAMTLTLVPGVKFDTKLTAGTSVLMIGPSVWSKVIVYPTTPTGQAAGIAMCVVTLAQYGYLQTHGLGSCRVDTGATPVVGLKLAPGDGTAGELDKQAVDVNHPTIAYMISAHADDTDHTACFIVID